MLAVEICESLLESFLKTTWMICYYILLIKLDLKQTGHLVQVLLLQGICVVKSWELYQNKPLPQYLVHLEIHARPTPLPHSVMTTRVSQLQPQ
uniref:Uncharacterized protein n=1 Tax=Rhizophora mucronata TaxID=61149 RepID=A0A2P2J6Y2_RHIMU